MDEEKTPVFKLAQLENSEKYAPKLDMLRTILDPNKEYTLAEVDELISKEMARPVVEEVNP